ncbi:ABC transporter [Pimelobacter simplex]|uniref:ABC transporter n=1 Tax=Nocardioides simplex TaxID=2045 RepID=A0A7J5DVC3_NOCSI|nr:ABC transporter [Pimelobacter simplex]KAB2809212.1 ABC transporter [Pimelobacter simplex]
MTQGLDDATKVPSDLATRGTAIGAKVAGLDTAAQAARGRLDDALLDDVAAAVEKSTGRLRLSARHTVVAIAGATGSGKSSTYNSLTGLELSSVGIRRPTTSWATAVIWGSEGAGELLEWLGIPPRHQTMRDSMLDTPRSDEDFDGVVLLDLPDHDSTEVSHHLEVDRLVATADLMVWILDPQKYADAAVHDRYFKPMSTHQDVILVALNHIDTVPPERRQSMIDDVRRLLAADGLPDVPVLPISAREGIGMTELRQEILRRVHDKQSTSRRVEADIAAAAVRLEQAGGTTPAADLAPSRIEDVEDRVADAAGVSAVVEGIERTIGERARRAVTWPPLALLGRRGDDEMTLSSEPKVAPLDRASVDTTIRGLADEAAAGVGPGWTRHVLAAATGRLDTVGERLDRELRGVDLGGRLPAWVGLVRVLNWLLLLAAVGGFVWWGVAAVQGSTGDLTEVAGLPLPAVLGIGGLVLGLLLAVLGGMLVRGLARQRAEAADERLRGIVHAVLDADVVQPLGAELASYAAFRRGINAARG